MTEKKKRCRYQVWDGPRGMSNYQCFSAAKATRPLKIRATKTTPEHREELPVCGTHANAYDRDPQSFAHSAYDWNGSPYKSKVQEYK